MITILQKNTTDCGVCCLAMALGLSYHATLAKLGSSYDVRTGITDLRPAFANLGLTLHSNPLAGADVTVFQPANDAAFQLLRQGRKAILSVPSLNREGGKHIIFWDGHKVHDPTNYNAYTTIDQALTATNVCIFR